jgi:amino acid adenylation domain-containing protein
VPGGGANIQDIYPLTPLQEGMLFHRLLEPDGGDIYVQALLVSLPSRQRLDAFVHAIQAVTARHDVLRTAFAWEGLRQPVQVVCRAAAVPVEELSLDPQTNAMAQMRKRMVAESMRIDLRAAPLMSLQIAADPRQQVCYALLKFHHAIHDHVSLEIMLEEVAWFMTGRAGELPEPAHFRAHVAQIGVYAKERDAESFFRGKLSDVSEPTAPFGLLEVRDGTQDLREARQRLDSALARRIRNQAWNLRVAAATLFHAAWAIVVARTAARDDIVFGSVLSGRLGGTAGGQRTLGMFINTLPVRLRLAELSVHELVQTTRREIMELLGHELASLAIAQRCSGLSGASLFSTVLNYRHTATDPEIGIVGKIVDLELLEFRQRTSYPVTLSVDDWGNEFALSAQSHPSIDPQRLIDYMTVALQSLVSALESAPDTRALALEIVGEQERRTLVRDFNATHTNYPRDALVHELFEQQTMQSPRVIAARWEDCSVTYDELNRRANQWAQWLIKRGVRPGECVPVAIPRSIESLVVQLALLKCGGVYVPIDSSLPLDRQQFMIGDCHASRMVRAPDDSASRPAISSLDVIDYAASSDAVHEQAEENLNLHLSALDPAYIMYTSGSTGAPKGVVVPHRAINRLVCNNTYARVEPTDRVSHCSNPAFDAATFEIWGALLNGATLVIVPQTVLLEPKHFAQLMLSERVTVLWITIGLLNQYVEELREVFPQLRYLITGGDVVDAETVRRVQRRGPQHFLNAYGPTECTTFSTIYEIGAADEVQPRIPIGKPVSNGQVYIVDAHLRPVPVAVVGEIFVGGDGVALEYLGRPDLTRERFVADPFSAVTGARLYRTGDLGRWRADGNIEFLGRNDQQVKFRGFRIELGEIEAHLMREEGIREAVVVARLDSHGKRLVAYLTLQSGRACSTENLRAALGKHLPEYMIPSAFVVLDAIPLTPNGKVDRRALPEPGTRAYASRGYEAPRNEAEHMLAEIWKDVLGLDRVGRQDHFFELGGHSLLAMQVVTRVRAAHSVEIPVKWLFESPTLAALAMRLAACRRENLIGWVSAGGEEMEELIRQISSMSEQDVGKRIEEMMGGRP